MKKYRQVEKVGVCYGMENTTRNKFENTNESQRKTTVCHDVM